MTDQEKTEIRMDCVIEAVRLKHLVVHGIEEYKDKSVVDIAQELSAFVYQDSYKFSNIYYCPLANNVCIRNSDTKK